MKTIGAFRIWLNQQINQGDRMKLCIGIGLALLAGQVFAGQCHDCPVRINERIISVGMNEFELSQKAGDPTMKQDIVNGLGAVVGHTYYYEVSDRKTTVIKTGRDGTVYYTNECIGGGCN